MKKRVLFVINSLAGGGAERVLTSLLAASKHMCSHYEISLALLDDEKREYEVPDWLTVHQLDARRNLVRSVLQLGRLVRTISPAVTVSFLTRANVASVALARRIGHRAVISERTNTAHHFGSGLGGKLSKAFVRAAYPLADHVIGVSDGVTTGLIEAFGVPRSKVSTIANPVDASRIRAAASAPVPHPIAGPYAVAVSRLTKIKNVRMLVDALKASETALPLVILGEGPERGAICARAAELGISGQVLLPGFVANPYPILRAASFYMSASNVEGFPNALIEALSLGVPAIVANCPSGPSEILAGQPREAFQALSVCPYGVLVPQNDIGAMAEGIREILRPSVAARLRAVGPSRAAEYSVERATSAYWDIIEAQVESSAT